MGGTGDGLRRQMEKLMQQAVAAGIIADECPLQPQAPSVRIPLERRDMVSWVSSAAGQHDPECGLGTKGDLVRWNVSKLGVDRICLPSVRGDMVQAAVDAKINVKGAELLSWLASRMNNPSRRVLILLGDKKRNSE